MSPLKFVDLYAGLGGFHVALRSLGHECVYACEVDEELRSIYKLNFGVEADGDIRKVKPGDMPAHDVLCAGFPCQPFSKAGEQQGLLCPKWGDLLEYTLTILKKRRPRYLILENVPNLTRHNHGATWVALQNKLSAIGYDISHKHLSPHHFGVPQIRERVFIVGSRAGLEGFCWPQPQSPGRLSITDALDLKPPDARQLTKQTISCMNVWQEFLEQFPRDEKLPSFPIWSMEFGADYPFEYESPFYTDSRSLKLYMGSHGKAILGSTWDVIKPQLPSYARKEEAEFPEWKKQFIRQNRELYRRNKPWIDLWIPKILQFPPSLQKLEWNCAGEERNIWKHVIQIRASGVRVKRPTTSPSLIAMTTTQVPIIAWECRYMTPRECARLQSLGSLSHLPKAATKAYKALGNAVNAVVAGSVAEALVGRALLASATDGTEAVP